MNRVENSLQNKTGVIDVGGGMRGAYGAGVLDTCMDLGIRFDVAIGVSAGAANLITYMAGQRGRNYRFYIDYSSRSEYMGIHNLASTGSYINLDYIYGDLSVQEGEDPLDFASARREFDSGREMIIVATDSENGEAVYFNQDDLKQDDYAPISASSCVPLVNRAYVIGDKSYFDGGLSDPVPVEKALKMGCNKIVLILTKPRDYYRETNDDYPMAKILEIRHPMSAKALKLRGDVYNFCLDKAKSYEKEGKVLIVSPDDIGDMRTLTRRRDDIEMLYQKGLEDGKRIKDFLDM